MSYFAIYLKRLLSVAFLLPQIASLKTTDRLNPLLIQRLGLALKQVEGYHHRTTYTLDFTCLGVDSPLQQVEAFRTDSRDRSLHCNRLSGTNLRQKVCLNVYYDHSIAPQSTWGQTV